MLAPVKRRARTTVQAAGLAPYPSSDDTPTEKLVSEFVPLTDDGETPDQETSGGTRSIPVPPHRFTPLQRHWPEIVEPIVKQLKLQVRMNLRRRCVEIRQPEGSPDTLSHLQKAADFVRAFLLGFEVSDALALLRLDDLFIESFEIKDVKRLVGDNLSRCIGRLSGREGKTKFAIENATRTRIVLADSKIHILGGFQNMRTARTALCNLILGSPPSKVYASLRTISRRLKESL